MTRALQQDSLEFSHRDGPEGCEVLGSHAESKHSHAEEGLHLARQRERWGSGGGCEGGEESRCEEREGAALTSI